MRQRSAKRGHQASLDWCFADQDTSGNQHWEMRLLFAQDNEDGANAKFAGAYGWQNSRRWRDGLGLAALMAILVWVQFGQAPTEATPQPVNKAMPAEETLETDFFQIHFAAQAKATVQGVAAEIDQRYQVQRREFGLPPPVEQNKLVIFIDDAPPAASAIDATQPVTTLVIPLTLLSSGSRDNELSTWLTKRLLDETSRQADFNPLWQPVLQGFQRYFVLRQQKREVWQALANFSEPGQLVAHLSLQIAQGPIEIGEETHPGQDSLRFFATTTWADYVVNTYGTQRLPALLKGFKRYNSWEELSPAVFGISAHQLEASWRKYLAIHYDR